MLIQNIYNAENTCKSFHLTLSFRVILAALWIFSGISYGVAQITPGKNQVFLYGQITNNINGAPVKDHLVYIMSDSSYNPGFAYYKEMLTDKEGFFYDTIYTASEKGSVQVYTYDLEENYYDTTVYFRFMWQEYNNLLIAFSITDSVSSISAYQADFTANLDTTGLHPLRYIFTDCSNTSNIETWEWDFGDGFYSSEQNPVHTYLKQGIYKVTLTIRGMFGPGSFSGESSISKIIRVFNQGYYHLGGQVFAGYFPIDIGMAYLYQLDQNNNLTLVDETVFDTLGCYYFYQLIEGDYIIKADLHANSNILQKFIATYYGNKLFWKDADTVCHHHSWFNYDIVLRPCVLTNLGPGSISGSISFAEGITGKGDPASNIQILLLDNTGLPVTGYHSGPDGLFQFEKLSYGPYLVHAEVTGKHTEPVEVLLDENTVSIGDIVIIINSHNVQGSVPFAIDEITALAADLCLYPNPATRFIHLKTESLISMPVDIRIYNPAMQVIYQNEKVQLQPGTVTSVDISGICAGVYFLAVQDASGVSVMKKFIVAE